MTPMLIVDITSCLRTALDEDIGAGDVTTELIVPEDAVLRGEILAKSAGVVSGLAVATQVFHMLDKRIEFDARVEDGASVKPGTIIAGLSGSARSLLTGERTALNFLNRMSGIATLTRQFVNAVSHTKAIILDTRKTAPGLRELDKLAVLHGGGQNHRRGLYDMILIKDNHIDFAGCLKEAVRRVRAGGTTLEIEVEVRTLTDLRAALDLGVERILLDNMNLDQLREAVSVNDGRAKLEASGNVSLENVSEIAETGVDFISVGALTHSAKSFDASMKWVG
jgi:nicotinate-nucleotide pyrophosphorylase (carboxylating)